MFFNNKMLTILFLILLVLYLIPTYREPRVVSNFITDEERSYIMREAHKKLNTSMVTQEAKVDKKIRDSETAWLSLNDPVVREVAERCVSLTDRPLVNCESLQVLKYGPNGFYKPHQDVIRGDKNYRMYTVILALNDDYEGGETVFPTINKRFKLKAGDALIFHTVDNYELTTSKSLHGGNPVKSGEKWICNLWVHKYPYHAQA